MPIVRNHTALDNRTAIKERPKIQEKPQNKYFSHILKNKQRQKLKI